jgi:Methyltransferase domain
MERHIGKELLDELPAADPRAVRSRRDLRRLNAFMGHASIMARALKESFSRHLSLRLIELGAGDGDFMRRVARRVKGAWRGVEATLVDRQDLLPVETHEGFAEVRWRVQAETRDVFQWLRESDAECEAITANLFLHHFNAPQLRELFQEAAAKSRCFVAIEPRRSRRALWFSRMLWVIGCNAVTRHDAPASVRAGFTDSELSALWPDHENWELIEQPAGWFSHLFIARRKERTDTSTLFQPIVAAVFNQQHPGGVPAADPSRDKSQRKRDS